MTDLPEPLIPPEVDIRGLPSFMLDVERLLASELVALSTGEELAAAVMLWCRAWQQHPAGSLPDDNRIMAAFSRAGARWPRVREMALRGFVKCSDGRLYHPVLCEQVMVAWARRLSYRADQERLRKWREAKRRNAKETEAETPTETGEETEGETRFNPVAETVTESDRQGQGQGQGQGQKERKKEKDSRSSLALGEPDGFGEFWGKYPRKDDKGHAAKAFARAAKKASVGSILLGLANYPFNADPQFVPLPATWLNGERWLGVEHSTPETQAVNGKQNRFAYLADAWNTPLPGDENK